MNIKDLLACATSMVDAIPGVDTEAWADGFFLLAEQKSNLRAATIHAFRGSAVDTECCICGFDITHPMHVRRYTDEPDDNFEGALLFRALTQLRAFRDIAMIYTPIKDYTPITALIDDIEKQLEIENE